MSMERWWDDTDRGKVKCSERNQPHWQFVQRNCHMTGLMSKPGLRVQAAKSLECSVTYSCSPFNFLSFAT